MQRRAIKVAYLTLCLALLVWLISTDSPRQRKISTIDHALTTHGIGRISRARRARLKKTVVEMLAAAGVIMPVAVDEPYVAGRLHVYTTSSSVQSITSCGAGNALYDSTVDAIFIDEWFFSTDGYRRIYERSPYASLMSFRDDLTFPEVFLRFVFLHELGHRQLRHHTGARAATARQQELAADRYALQALEKFYTYDRQHGDRLVGEPLREAVGLSDFFDGDIEPRTQVYVDLVGTLFMMANFNLYLDTPYSPFSENTTHPAFLERARGAVTAALTVAALPPKLRANFSFLRESLAREASVRREPFVEVLVPGAVDDVSFASDGLRVLHGGHMSTIKRLTTADAIAHRLIVADAGTEYGPPPQTLERNRAFWSRPDGTSIIVEADGDVWRYRAGRREPYVVALPWPLATTKCFVLFTPPQPADVAVAKGCDDGGTDWLSSLMRDERTASRSIPAIMLELTQRLGHTVDDYEVIGVSRDAVFLALENRSEKRRLIGRATLNIRSLQITDAQLFCGDTSLLERSNGSNKTWPLLATAAGDYVLSGRPDDELILVAWQVGSSRSPTKVASHELLVRRISGTATPDLIADFDPYLIATWSLTSTQSLAYWANDSLLRFDTAQRRLDVVFHPTFEGVEVRVGLNGRFAVFMPGGSRVFVFGGS